MEEVDNLIIGGGYFGIYAASCAPKIESVQVLDAKKILQGASKFNQARLHSGAHYLRSPQTIRKCQSDFVLFSKEFGSALNTSFQSIYALPIHNNLASPETFEHLMSSYNVPFEVANTHLLSSKVFPKTYLVSEPTIDHYQMSKILLANLGSNVTIHEDISGLQMTRNSSNGNILIQYEGHKGSFELKVKKRLILAAYDSNPSLANKLKLTTLSYTIEKARILYAYIPQLRNIGFTLVDGQFISAIPWGLTGLHSVTSVSHSHSIAQPEEQIDSSILKHVRSFFESDLDFYIHEEKSINKIFWNPNPIFDERITCIQKLSPADVQRPQIFAINSSKLSSLQEVRSIFNG